MAKEPNKSPISQENKLAKYLDDLAKNIQGNFNVDAVVIITTLHDEKSGRTILVPAVLGNGFLCEKITQEFADGMACSHGEDDEDEDEESWKDDEGSAKK